MIKNLKKVISSAAAVAIVASSASAFAVTFPDVDESASYANAVETVSALGVVVGDENGLFNPDANVTRAEFTTMVVRALGEEAAATAATTSSFTDAANTSVHWAAGYIAQGVADGWINGYGDGTFKPDNTVTYAEAVKMLVSAIGYELYAQNAGGYPSGYLSYGGSLDIIDGVSVEGNSTELTRSQCAVLVNNAMQAPLVLTGDITVGGSLGTVTEQQYTTMNGTGSGWQTLLTKFHDAYVVRGRVMETSKSQSGSGLDDDEVSFRVEAADNFDNEYYGSTGSDPVEFDMRVGDTDAANRIFEYSEAVVQKNKDTDEWVILSINTYGQSKTETFAASDVDSDGMGISDPVDTTDFSGVLTDSSMGNYRIPVFKGTSTSTTKYRVDENVALYVNGVEVSADLDDAFGKYVLLNSVGDVTLIDSTEPGSTSTDGYYDFIMVDYYVDAVVDSVTESSSNIRMFFKANDSNVAQSRLQWDPENEDVTVTFTKDDAEIAYTDVAEFDVLSIAYDVEVGFAQSTFYDVIVSSNTVSGRVTSRDEEDGVVTIDGNEYEFNERLYNINNVELSTDYTLYLDAFGYVAYIGEGDSAKNYGIVVGMYMGSGDELATVRLIGTDGNIVEYEARDEAAQNAFWNILTGEETYSTKGGPNGNGTVNKSNLTEETIQNNVVVYTLSSGDIRLREHLDPVNDNGVLPFRTSGSNSRLGNYTISDTATKIIDVDSYLGSDSNAGVMSVSSFAEDTDYTAYVYDRSNTSNVYRFVIVVEGTASINPDTTFAVVKSNPRTTDIDGTEYLSMTVCRDGAEDVTLLYEDTKASFTRGDVVIYSMNADGTANELHKIISMSGMSRYESLRDAALANDNFSSFVSSDVLPYLDDKTDPRNEWFKSTDNKEAEAYFGPILRKDASSIDLIVSQSNGESNINEDIESFTIDSTTDVYVYDYSERSDSDLRVYAGQGGNSTDAIYNGTYVDKDETIVSWDDVISDNVRPNFALVKVVDNDVTEVVVFVAN